MPEVNGLVTTKARLALTRAIHNDLARIYYEPSAKTVWDKHTAFKVTSRVEELLRHDWIRALAPDEPRRPGEQKLLVYYRLRPFGAVALGVATNSIEKEQGNG